MRVKVVQGRKSISCANSVLPVFISGSGYVAPRIGPELHFAVQIDTTLYRQESRASHGFQRFYPSFNRTVLIQSTNGVVTTLLTPWHNIDFYMATSPNNSGLLSKDPDPTVACIAWLSTYGATLTSLMAEYPGYIGTSYGCSGNNGTQPYGVYLMATCITGFEPLRAAGGIDQWGQTIPGGVCNTRAISEIIAMPGCDCDKTVGNPISPALGIKSHREKITTAATRLGFDLFYNTYNFNSAVKRAGWSHTYSGKIAGNSYVVTVNRPEGHTIVFSTSDLISYAPRRRQQGEAYAPHRRWWHNHRVAICIAFGRLSGNV